MLTAGMQARIVSMLNDGASVQAVAAETGATVRQVRMMRARMRTKHAQSQAEIDAAILEHAKAGTLAEGAESLGLSYRYARNRLAYLRTAKSKT